ncbi:MAG: LptF/LptG family permease [Deltaproteobacteria bacterium]|nr:LptF/LptG family permease [Deltaproteobacteria bacterium]
MTAAERPVRRQTGARLTRYLIAEMWLPTVFAIVVFGLVVLLTDLLGYAELIVNRGLEPGEVGQIALLQLVPTLARTLPFAVLVGSLVALGRLSADRELLALEASGLSPRQLARPGLYFALVATLISIAMSALASPAAQNAVREKMIALVSDKPGLSLQPGIASRLGGWRIEARKVEEDGTRLRGVLVYMPSLRETIFSQRGTVSSDASASRRIVLEDGIVLTNGNERSSVLRFERMETRLPELSPADDLPVDEISALPFAELLGRMDEETSPRHRRRLHVEAHNRFALGAAALPFGLLAMGLALGRRDLSRSGGAVMGLVGVFSYYALFQLSEGMLRSENAPVGLVVWMPNAVLTLVAGVLILRAGRHASESDRGPARRGGRILERAGLARRGLRMKRWALPRYVSAQFVRMVALCIVGLVFAYLIIDIFDNLKWFNRYGATAAEIGRFYAARLPVLIARVVPMALLIAVALTISVLGTNGELLGMRACGIPVFRVLAPVWMLCALAVPADHLLANELVPRSSERATYLKRTEIKNRELTPREARERVWYRVGSRIHEMASLDLLRGQASAITLYDLDEAGLPMRRIDAEGARHLGRGLWLLDAPRSVEFDGDALARDPSPARLVEFGEENAAEVDTAHLTPGDLRAALDDPELEGIVRNAYRTDLQMKFAAPLACLLLPLIALFFAATGPPFPRPVHTLIASVIIAVTHAIVTSFAGTMGYGGTISPWLAGWAPPFFFGLAAFAMGLRLRRRLSRAG